MKVSRELRKYFQGICKILTAVTEIVHLGKRLSKWIIFSREVFEEFKDITKL